jgi:trimeric autotransporter adhesin
MSRSSLIRFVPRPTYANVIATIALFIALGGAAVAAGLPRNSVGVRQLKRGSVTPAKIRKGAVTAGKLAPQSVTAGKLGANAVLPGNLGNGIISTQKIAAGAVIASTIKNGVITNSKLANGSVSPQKLADNAVTAAKLAEKSVTPAKLSFATSAPGTVSNLASGQTLRGVFDLGATAATANDITKGAVSYPLPLAATPPQVNVLKPGEVNANCPGLGTGSSTPTAAAGNLCVYLGQATNLDEAELPKLVEANTRLGFGLSAKAKAAGEFVALGQWAVTAP